MNADQQKPDENPREARRHERNVFLFLTVVLAPAVAIAAVTATGFAIWFMQMLAGPPGPGH